MESKKPLQKRDEKQEKRPTCFVIMPFSDPDPYPKGHFDKVYRDIFAPAITEAGFEPFRVDEDFRSSSILAKIVEGLVTAPMALCDLSARNPNVLYELGVRHAFDMPVVLVCECGSNSIFDLSDIATVSYRKERIYDEVFEDQQNITQALKATARNSGKSSLIQLAKIEKARKEGLEATGQDTSDLIIQSLANDIISIKKLLQTSSYERNLPAKRQYFDLYKEADKRCTGIIITLQKYGDALDIPSAVLKELQEDIFFVSRALDDGFLAYSVPSDAVNELKGKLAFCRRKYTKIIGNLEGTILNTDQSCS
ncbi:MAG TPA: hypothetical protein PKB13_12090 [Clostridia bacterium]|nr:hypothetical protein [Clostridia bacterium]